MIVRESDWAGRGAEQLARIMRAVDVAVARRVEPVADAGALAATSRLDHPP